MYGGTGYYTCVLGKGGRQGNVLWLVGVRVCGPVCGYVLGKGGPYVLPFPEGWRVWECGVFLLCVEHRREVGGPLFGKRRCVCVRLCVYVLREGGPPSFLLTLSLPPPKHSRGMGPLPITGLGVWVVYRV